MSMLRPPDRDPGAKVRFSVSMTIRVVALCALAVFLHFRAIYGDHGASRHAAQPITFLPDKPAYEHHRQP